MGSYKINTVQGTIGSVEDAFSVIAELGDEMRSNADNMQGTNLEQTEKYTTTEEAADTLEAISAPDVPEVISDIGIEWSEAINKRKGRGESRDVRLSNALACIEAAAGAAQAWLEEHPEHEDADDVSQFHSELEDACDIEVEFPRMFG